MKKHISLLLIVLLATTGSALARTYHFSGGGGFALGFHSPNFDFLNTKLQKSTPGFDKVEGPLVLYGGFGYGEVADNFRIGGFGFGGASTFSGRIPGPNGNRQDVTFGLSAGGFLVEYVPFNFAKRLEIDLDLGIGFGEAELSIDQFDSNVTWDDMMGSLHPDSTGSRQTFSISMSQGLFMVEPAVALKFYINSWMAIEGRAGYLLLIGMDDWQFKDVKVLDMPDVDLSAPVFGLRVTFGG